MATPKVAYNLKVQVAPDSSNSPGTYAAPSNQTNVKIDIKGEQIDISQLNSAGYRERIAGLIDVSGTVDGFVDYADTAQSTLITAITTRVPCWVKVFIDGSHYVQAQVNVESLSFELDPAGASKFSGSLTLAGLATSPVTIA